MRGIQTSSSRRSNRSEPSAFSASTPSFATDVKYPALVRTLLNTRRVVLSSSTTRIRFMMFFAFAGVVEVCAWRSSAPVDAK